MARRATLIKRLIAEFHRQIFLSWIMSGLSTLQAGAQKTNNPIRFILET
jgi:hypothetical protein